MVNKFILWSFCLIVLSSCVVSPPKKTTNICEIFYEKRSWYKAAVKTEKKWGSPAYVTLAFIKQESDFQQGAKPERTKLLGFIPWKRKSSAYGYAQAIDGTWDLYKKQAKKPLASRTSFKDSVDFIGWYNKKAISFWEFLKIMQGCSILLITKDEEGIKKEAINLSLGCFRYPQTFKKCLIDTETNTIVVKRN